MLTITAKRSPVEFKLSAVADDGLVMWVKIDFTASLVGLRDDGGDADDRL